MSVPPERSPAYPPRFTYKQAVRLTIAALKQKPALPPSATVTGETESAMDVNLRRLVDRYVLDRQHREQLRIWAWCQKDEVPARGRPSLTFQDGKFAEQCRERGWSPSTALRNVDDALGMVFMMLNLPNGGQF